MPSDAAFLGKPTSSCAGVTSLSIENGKARMITGRFSMAGDFHFVKDSIRACAYGVYSTKIARLEIAARLENDDMFRATPADMSGRTAGFLQKLFPRWTPPIGKSNDYFVFQDERMLGTLRAKCQNKHVDLIIERENQKILAHAKMMRSYRSFHLDVFILGSSWPLRFDVVKKSSILHFIAVILSLLLFLWWWCKPWKRRFPIMDMILPSSLSRHSLNQDDVMLLFALSLLIRTDWLKHRFDDDFGG